jgi:hypothetical protein
MQQLSEESARTLLGVAEQRREHLSTAIRALNGLALTIVVGLWTFFLKSFLDASSFVNPAIVPEYSQPFAFSYVVMAAGLSAIVLGLWRLYVRYIDDEIANIYPEIMSYEQVLGVGSSAGIQRSILKQRYIRAVFAQLYQTERQQLVARLVEDRRIGRRGHDVIDTIVFVALFLFVVAILGDVYIQLINHTLNKMVSWSEILSNPLLALKWVGYFLIGVGSLVCIYAFFRFQRNPTQADVIDALSRVRQVTTNQARPNRTNEGS